MASKKDVFSKSEKQEQEAQDTQAPAPAPEAPAPEAPAQESEQKLQVAKRLTIKSVYGSIDVSKLPPLFTGSVDAPIPNPNPEFKLCRFAGFARDTKSGVTQYGDWHSMVGEFSAINYTTGEYFLGKQCMIPGPMNDALCDSVTESISKDPAAKVRFSVDVWVKRNKREPMTKYDYVVRPVLAAKLESPALALLGMS